MLRQHGIVMRLLLVMILTSAWLQPVFAYGYKLSVTPRFSAQEMFKRLGPLAKLLSEQLHNPVEITLTGDFQDYADRLKDGQFDIAFSNPTHYVKATDANEVIAMEVKDSGSRLRGIIIVRADSAIKSVQDLIGHSVSIVSWQSTGGYLSQKVFLEAQGIHPKTQCELQEAYDNKQENVILSVYYGDVDVGFINEDSLHIVDAYVPPEQIRIIEYTSWLPNWALSIKRNLSEVIQARIRDAVFGLKPNDPVLKALKIKKFMPAVDADYDVIRNALDIAIHPTISHASQQQ